MSPQCKRVLGYMERNGSITSLQAIEDLGVMELPRRICDLMEHGYAINKERIKVKNRYGETMPAIKYSLADREG